MPSFFAALTTTTRRGRGRGPLNRHASRRAGEPACARARAHITRVSRLQKEQASMSHLFLLLLTATPLAPPLAPPPPPPPLAPIAFDVLLSTGRCVEDLPAEACPIAAAKAGKQYGIHSSYFDPGRPGPACLADVGPMTYYWFNNASTTVACSADSACICAAASPPNAPPPPRPPRPPRAPPSDGLSDIVVAGLILGGTVVLLLLLASLWWVWGCLRGDSARFMTVV
jgi:hypothetical protein